MTYVKSADVFALHQLSFLVVCFFYILANIIINPAGFTHAKTWLVSYRLQGDFPQIVLEESEMINTNTTVMNSSSSSSGSKSKGKAVPLQAWSDPESSRKLRFPDYVTTAQGWW